MQIHYKIQDDCSLFIFCDLIDSTTMKLPLNIAVPDLLLLIQGSLDQIRPVILLNRPEVFSHINLSKLKSHHFQLVKNEYAYLNYSIRNSLSRFDSSLVLAKSFDEIYDYLEHNLQKNI